VGINLRLGVGFSKYSSKPLMVDESLRVISSNPQINERVLCPRKPTESQQNPKSKISLDLANGQKNWQGL
jgi:hypothetical protein